MSTFNNDLQLQQINTALKNDGGISLLNGKEKQILNKALDQFNKDLAIETQIIEDISTGKVKAKIFTKDEQVVNLNSENFLKLQKEDRIKDIFIPDEAVEKYNIKNDISVNPNAYTGINTELFTLKAFEDNVTAGLVGINSSLLSTTRINRLVRTFGTGSIFRRPDSENSIMTNITNNISPRLLKSAYLQQTDFLNANQFIGYWNEYENGYANDVNQYSYNLPQTFASYVFQNEFNQNASWLEYAMWNSFSAFGLATPVSASAAGYTGNLGDYNPQTFNRFDGLLAWILQSAGSGFVDPVGKAVVAGSSTITSANVKATLDLMISSARKGIVYKEVNGEYLCKFAVSYDVYEAYQSQLNAATNYNGISQLMEAQNTYRGYKIVKTPGLPPSTIIFAPMSNDTKTSALQLGVNTLDFTGTNCKLPNINSS